MALTKVDQRVVTTQVAQYSAGGAQSISNNTYTKIQFPTVIFDPSSIWSTVNNRFTATIAGIYRIGSVIGTVGGGGAYNVSVYVYKNGSPYLVLCQITSNNSDAVGGSCLVSLAAGDYVEIFFRQQSGSSQTIETSSYVEIEQVSG